MSKKIILIFIIVVIILIAGFFIFKTTKDKEELNISNEQNIQNEENIQNNETVQNTSTYVENIENQETDENNNNVTINQEVSPSGFMGSSLYKVVLYSNKEVYVQTYDGNGYDEQNMVSKTLIAKDVDSISVSQDEMHLGEVIIKGGTPVNQDMGWIVFE